MKVDAWAGGSVGWGGVVKLEPVPYSSMTEANRKMAAVWFGVGDYR